MTGRRAVGSTEDVVVTPVWRPMLTDDERWNVARTLASTAGTDHVLLAPRSLEVEWYRNAFPGSRVLRGPDGAFGSVWDYSRAMLAPRLYEAFAGHRFLVLAQTDAFLLRDPAPVLARATWDFAGAPFSATYRMSALTAYSRRLGEWEQRVRPRPVLRIGNGGLSVRRVSAFIGVLRRKPLLHRLARTNEDLVLAHLGELGALRLPSVAEADAMFFDESERDPLAADVLGYHALQQKHPEAYRVLRERYPVDRATDGRWVSRNASS